MSRLCTVATADLVALLCWGQVFHKQDEITRGGIPLGVVTPGDADVNRWGNLEVEAHFALVVPQPDPGRPTRRVG